jgi:hypothetical protein
MMAPTVFSGAGPARNGLIVTETSMLRPRRLIARTNWIG